MLFNKQKHKIIKQTCSTKKVLQMVEFQPKSTFFGTEVTKSALESTSPVETRGESPACQLSPRTKIMAKVPASRKFCHIKKSFVFFTAAFQYIKDPESGFRNLLFCQSAV